MADWEKEHIVAAFRFELGKVGEVSIREGVVRNLANVDHDLAARVAEGVGVEAPGDPAGSTTDRRSPALSQDNGPKDSVATRQIAVLAADGVDADQIRTLTEALTGAGAKWEVLAAADGTLRAAGGGEVAVTRALTTVASVLYDAVLVPGGEQSVRTLAEDGDAVHFLSESFKHGKAVGALGAGVSLLEIARITSVRRSDGDLVSDQGVITTTGPADGAFAEAFAEAFVTAVAAHRHPGRDLRPVPA